MAENAIAGLGVSALAATPGIGLVEVLANAIGKVARSNVRDSRVLEHITHRRPQGNPHFT